MGLIEQLKETKAFLESKATVKPEIGIILGSGLGGLATRITNDVAIPFKDIPHFAVSTTPGHKGIFHIGDLSGKKVTVMEGRFHYYEGYEMIQVTYPIRTMQVMGVKILIVTSATGAIKLTFKPGDLVLIKDHVNLMGVHPLRGQNIEELGPRFVDITEAYDKILITIAKRCGKKLKIPLKTGVYAAVCGPSYETPSTIKMLRIYGADLVGMSTVPDVLAARHGGIRVLGIACVSNMAAGILKKPITHKEVLETTKKTEKKFIALIESILLEI